MEIKKPNSQQKLHELYEKAEKIVPLAEKNGQIYCTFEDASILNSINALEPSTGMQTRNADGSLASTGKTVHAINPDYFFLNRYKVKGKKLYVVSGHEPIGYRCIREQSSGHVFVKTVPVYIITRDAEGNLICEAKSTIDDKTFIESFTETLANSVMAEVLPLLTEMGNDLTPIQKMPI